MYVSAEAVAGVVEHAADEPNPGWARNIRRGLWPSATSLGFVPKHCKRYGSEPANEQQQRISVSLAASVLRLEIRRYRLGRKKGEDYKDELSLNPLVPRSERVSRERERR